MTAVAEDLDLSWVAFSDELEDEPCDGLCRESCDMEAVAAVVWQRPCEHEPVPEQECAAHRDQLAAEAAACDSVFSCTECQGLAVLLRIEPIR